MRSLTKILELGASRFSQQPEISWANNHLAPTRTGIREWLLQGTGYNSVKQNQNGAVEIDLPGRDTTWADANGSDLIAHREAALESLYPRNHECYNDTSAAWPLISNYYAAYFAAQALLRCLGIGTMYLDKEEEGRVNEAWNLRGFKAKLVGSNYRFLIDSNGPSTITIYTNSRGTGAHATFWSTFKAVRNEIDQRILLGKVFGALDNTTRISGAQEIAMLLSQCFTADDAIDATFDYQWLSDLRNRINYRFDENVWMMSWNSRAGLVSGHQKLIERTLSKMKPISIVGSNTRRLIVVATLLCKLVHDSTATFKVPLSGSMARRDLRLVVR